MERWKCVYRSTYAAWRPSVQGSASRPVLIYCPAPVTAAEGKIDGGDRISKGSSSETTAEKQCRAFEQQYTDTSADGGTLGNTVSYKLQLHLTDPALTPLEAEFSTYKDSGQVSRFWAQERAGRTPVAVCTAWPYTTSDFTKTHANQAMVYEFLRYYSNLGFWLMVYDNNGVNMKGVFDSAYARANPQRGRFAGAIDKYLMYHNYTIAGLIAPQSSPHYYDNDHTRQQSVRQETTFIQGDDKTSTLTHCRFEARARYGIERVLVVDFDEFLFAQGGGTDPEQQRHYMDQYFDNQTQSAVVTTEAVAKVLYGNTGRLEDGAGNRSSIDIPPVWQQTAGGGGEGGAGGGAEQLMFYQSIPMTRSRDFSLSARDCVLGVVNRVIERDDASRASYEYPPLPVSSRLLLSDSTIGTANSGHDFHKTSAGGRRKLDSHTFHSSSYSGRKGSSSGHGGDIGSSLPDSASASDVEDASDQQLQLPAGDSILECFGGSNSIAMVSFIKSLHLSYACPLTNFHHACNLSPESWRFRYDCLCREKDEGSRFRFKENQWLVFHLSVHNPSHPIPYVAPENLPSQSELWKIANAQ